MLGVHVSLNPIIISKYSDLFELTVMEVKAATKFMRVITGYGPQETCEIYVKMKFSTALKEDLVKAALLGMSAILIGGS